MSACSGSDNEPLPSDAPVSTTSGSDVATTSTTVAVTSTPSTTVGATSTTVAIEPSPSSTEQSPVDTDPDRPFVINGPATVDPDDQADVTPTSDAVVDTAGG